MGKSPMSVGTSLYLARSVEPWWKSGPGSAGSVGLRKPTKTAHRLTQALLRSNAQNNANTHAPRNDTPALISDLKNWLDAHRFDCQQLNTEDHDLLIQVKKRGGWREFVGMATSLNIVFHQSGDNLIVEIGAGKWIDKAAAGVVSLVVLWPLAVTAVSAHGSR
jgi:hypothetical protein